MRGVCWYLQGHNKPFHRPSMVKDGQVKGQKGYELLVNIVSQRWAEPLKLAVNVKNRKPE